MTRPRKFAALASARKQMVLRIAAQNPDLPLDLVEGIVEARAEFKAGSGKPYDWTPLAGHPPLGGSGDKSR